MPQERSGYNNLTISVYNAFSTALVYDTSQDLDRVQGVKFEQVYPGGLYSVCALIVYRDPTRSWPFKQGQRLVVRNGLTIVWEGVIVSIGYQTDAATGARTIAAAGFGADGLLGRTGLRKAWADNRINSTAWPLQNISQYQQVSVNRNSVIRITPADGLRWNAGDYAAVRYTMPTGQLVRRIKFNYDFGETANVAPSLILYFQTAGATYTKETALYDGNAAAGLTFATFITTDLLYIGMNAGDTDKLQPGDTGVFTVTMGATKNAIASVLSAEYWSTNAGGWAALTVTDNTASAGKTLAQSGTITFAKPGDMGATPLGDANKSSKIWVRFKVSVNLTANIVVNEIAFGQQQDWYVVVYNGTTAAEIAATKISATGTGSIDNTLATPAASVQLRLVSNVQQTPFGNGTIYGEFSSLMVYADANTITATEIVKDWISNVANLNSDTSRVASNTLSVEPWITGQALDFEFALDNLLRLAALGDASSNAWACQVLDSENTATPAGTPVLSYQQQPALSDYDYVIAIGSRPGTLQSINIVQTPIYNDIIASYTDLLGNTQWLTSADDATLKDATSIAAYGTVQYKLQANTTSATIAAGIARRFLAQNKDVHFYVSGSLTAQSYILSKGGNPIPASEVKAGKRVQVPNFLSDEVGVTGAGLTFIISHVAYDDDTEMVSIDCGLPDDLAVWIAQLAFAAGAKV